MTQILMHDATPGGVDAIPEDAQAVAGYLDGLYVSFPALVRRFYPHAHCVSIGIFLDTLAAFTDVEEGNPVNTPALVRASFEYRKAHGVWRPGFYGDHGHMSGIILPGVAGIPREEYRLWLADWDGIYEVPAGYEAKQVTNNSRHGREGPYDTSVVHVESFFPQPAHKPHKPIFHHHPKQPGAPKPKRKVHPKVIGATGGGGIGIGIVALLNSFGVHVTPTEGAEISTLVAAILGYLVPSSGGK